MLDRQVDNSSKPIEISMEYVGWNIDELLVSPLPMRPFLPRASGRDGDCFS